MKSFFVEQFIAVIHCINIFAMVAHQNNLIVFICKNNLGFSHLFPELAWSDTNVSLEVAIEVLAVLESEMICYFVYGILRTCQFFFCKIYNFALYMILWCLSRFLFY